MASGRSLVGICIVVAAVLAGGAEAQSLVVVGDPQLHNVQGGQVFQTSALAAIGVKVAQRYPEQNLLADFLFEELIDRASALDPSGAQAPVVLLGDGMNEACSSEFDRVDAKLEAVRKTGRIALWAPGNHDVYLAGTVNQRFPSNAIADAAPLQAMSGSPLPIDRSWWRPAAHVTASNAWNAMCADQGRGVPMNKGQWIRRYADRLGLALASEPAPDNSYRIRGAAPDGSRLAQANYVVLGRWFPPARVGNSSPAADWFAAYSRPYRSYIVQAVDLGTDRRLVLIDTGVCERASLTAQANAGTNACVPAEELADIAELSKTSRRLIFGGHFPLNDLKPADQDALLGVFNEGGRAWTYLSAHTHAPATTPDHSRYRPYAGNPTEHRYDFNVGSTTDWPNEAHLFMANDTEKGGEMKKVDLGRTFVPYRAPVLNSQTELCRHLLAAQRLAGLPADAHPAEWKGGLGAGDTPALVRCEHHRDQAVADLAAARSTIERRLREGPDAPAYRALLLSIARGASHAYDQAFSLGDLIRIP